jgi:hypothetical protein
MDMVATYAASKAWNLRPNIVLVEGTSDEALFKLADEIVIANGGLLLGDEICIVAAGQRDRGGTYGVARELITLRSMVPLVLDRDGRPVYRVMGLVDNDEAGRRIIRDVLRMDRSAIEFHDIIALPPAPPVFSDFSPIERRRECDQANLPYRGLDWEIEDALSPRLLTIFDQRHPGMITRRDKKGGKTHHEIARVGKAKLHHMVHRETIFADLDGVIQIVNMLRSLLGVMNGSRAP